MPTDAELLSRMGFKDVTIIAVNGKKPVEVKPKASKAPKARKDLADDFAALWRNIGPREYPLTREYYFAKPRRWRFDAAWPDQFVAVEMEGGIWSRGRHTRGVGVRRDMEKYNTAARLGWCVLRFATNDLKDDPVGVVEQVTAALGRKE
jgi:very-short-patch-repair endonuclease